MQRSKAGDIMHTQLSGCYSLQIKSNIQFLIKKRQLFAGIPQILYSEVVQCFCRPSLIHRTGPVSNWNCTLLPCYCVYLWLYDYWPNTENAVFWLVAEVNKFFNTEVRMVPDMYKCTEAGIM